MTKTALITGITGQDGSYLAEFLLEKGYKVFGLVRRTSINRLDRIEHVLDRIGILSGDLSDSSSLSAAVRRALPDEVYNLAAQSFVPTSWEQPVLTSTVNALGTTRLLEALKALKPDAKFYQASSSEMFGQVAEIPQTEKTPFHPRSPYGVSKCYAHMVTVNYRESYGMFCVSGILFNHESPRRGLEFVTRKITHAAARIKKGLQEKLELGNLAAKRDWGWAPDYVDAMWRMLQAERPDDYVIATGETHSVEEFCALAFDTLGLDHRRYVVSTENQKRPAEVDLLVGNAEKACRILKWEPVVRFPEVVRRMADADLQALNH
jgi:GDPmannose 4,6-dehydratase